MQLTKTESLREAQQYIDQGRVSSAIRIYQKVVDDDLSDLNTISKLGDLYVKAGRIADAVEHFVRIAENYLRSGSGKSAAYILNKALKLDGANPRAHMNLGELHLGDNEITRAHNAFIEAGAGFWHEGNITSAIEMNKRALEIVPDSQYAKSALAFIKWEMDKSAPPEPRREIVSDLPEFLISIPDESDSVCAPLTFESQLNPDSTSDVDSKSRRELAPGRDEDSIVKQIAIAEYLVGRGQVDQAIGVLRESLIDQPDHIQTREKLKDIFLRSEMTDRASEECVNIAAIYLARGETSRASEYVTRARLLRPSLEPVSARATPQTDTDEEFHCVLETGGDGPELRQSARIM